MQARRKQFISVTGTARGSAHRRVAAIRLCEARCHSGLRPAADSVHSRPDMLADCVRFRGWYS